MGLGFILFIASLLAPSAWAYDVGLNWNEQQKQILELNAWSRSPTLRNVGERTAPSRLTHQYYLWMGGYETPGLIRPDEKTSHTFAVFYSTEDPADTFTISWLPVRFAKGAGDIIVRGGVSEYGKNFSFEQTLALAGLSRRKLLRWGPYQITPEFYRKAHYQYSYLERYRGHELEDPEVQEKLGVADPPARVHYQVMDGNSRNATYLNKLNDLRSQLEMTRDPFYADLFNRMVLTLPLIESPLAFSAVHCIHAISDIESFLRTLMERGYVATHLVFSSFAQKENVDKNFVAFVYDREVDRALDILDARLDQNEIRRFSLLHGGNGTPVDLRAVPPARVAYPGKYKNSILLGPARAFSDVWNTAAWK